METKVCFKCGLELPLSSFYAHNRMGDGHLNKCIECTKTDAKRNYDKKASNPAWVAKERIRGREKYKRLGYVSSCTLQKAEKQALYPELRKNRKRNPIEDKGFEYHHWNYNFLDDVIRLPRRLHHRLHSILQFNLKEGIYYYQGKTLNTKALHMSVIKIACEEFGFNYNEIIK